MVICSCLAATALDENQEVCSVERYDIRDETDCEQLPDDLPVFDLRSDHVQNHVRMVQITDVGDSWNDVTLLKKDESLFLQTKICEISQIRINLNSLGLVVNKHCQRLKHTTKLGDANKLAFYFKIHFQ